MIARMGRPRNTGSKDLPDYLYVDRDGNFYIVVRILNPATGKKERRQAYLGTKDREEAKQLYWQRKAKFDDALLRAQAKQIADRLQALERPAIVNSFAKYCEYYRTKKLPHAVIRKTGKPLSEHTKRDYRNILQNAVEPCAELAIALEALDEVVLRAFLSQWLDNPAHYNYVMSILSRVIKCAIDEGKLRSNPLALIERRAVAERKVYVPDADYRKIAATERDWIVRAWDLIYFASHRPGDCLALAERNVNVEIHPFKEADGSVVTQRCTIVRFTATKNDQPMEIVDKLDGPLTATIEWFRKFREAQELFSNAATPFVLHPRTAPRRYIGKPVPVGYVSKAFTAAVVEAKFTKGKYKLKDLRKKGLTDEAQLAGKPTDKGGHKTESMKRLYVVGELPMRVQNNLREIKR